MVVDAHTNESVGSVKRKIAEAVKQPEDQISLSFGEVSLDGAGKQVLRSFFISPTKSAKQRCVCRLKELICKTAVAIESNWMETIAEFESEIRNIEALMGAKALEELTKKALVREFKVLDIAPELLLKKLCECTETATNLESKVGQLEEKMSRASETEIQSQSARIKNYYRFAFCRQSSLI